MLGLLFLNLAVIASSHEAYPRQRIAIGPDDIEPAVRQQCDAVDVVVYSTARDRGVLYRGKFFRLDPEAQYEVRKRGGCTSAISSYDPNSRVLHLMNGQQFRLVETGVGSDVRVERLPGVNESASHRSGASECSRSNRISVALGFRKSGCAFIRDQDTPELVLTRRTTDDRGEVVEPEVVALRADRFYTALSAGLWHHHLEIGGLLVLHSTARNGGAEYINVYLITAQEAGGKRRK